MRLLTYIIATILSIVLAWGCVSSQTLKQNDGLAQLLDSTPAPTAPVVQKKVHEPLFTTTDRVIKTSVTWGNGKIHSRGSFTIRGAGTTKPSKQEGKKTASADID